MQAQLYCIAFVLPATYVSLSLPVLFKYFFFYLGHTLGFLATWLSTNVDVLAYEMCKLLYLMK